ncbi:MAG: hypothetical protein HRU38_08525 [Saccharospirillaceae bacterium]|nr:hypothetical protein [Pseudomonadales bacterium]NRB78698.1 hypothetical protein [Saccharospirillaceae bacterium]
MSNNTNLVDNELINLINKKIQGKVRKKHIISVCNLSKPTLDSFLKGDMSQKTKLIIADYLGYKIEVVEILVEN